MADKAVRDGFTSKFIRYPRLFTEINTARLDGSLTRYLGSLAKTDLLILDDWDHSLNESERRDLFEIIEDRNEKSSTIITSQIPIEKWHGHIGDPTVADAILDRIIHRAHQIKLDCRSLRGKTNTDIERKEEKDGHQDQR